MWFKVLHGVFKTFPTCPIVHSPVQSTLLLLPARKLLNLFRLKQMAQVIVPAILLVPVLK